MAVLRMVAFCVRNRAIGKINDVEQSQPKNPAAQELGRIRTEKKARAARENGRAGGRPHGTLKPLAATPCTCGGGAVLTPVAHPASCLRGRAIRRRLRKNQPLT